MDRKQAKNLICIAGHLIKEEYKSIICAFARGNTIERQQHGYPDTYIRQGENMCFTRPAAYYRIKPEESKMVKIVCDGKEVEISRESAKALNLLS